MSRYGSITDYGCSAQEFRVKSFLQEMNSIDFGNCGVPTKLQDHLIRDKKGIEDIFVLDDSLYILPRSKQSAKYLFDVVMNDYNAELNDSEFPLADEIDWCKLGDRYYLRLWWD